MNIDDKSVKELRRILKKDLGRKLTDKQARRIGEWLLRFYGRLAK